MFLRNDEHPVKSQILRGAKIVLPVVFVALLLLTSITPTSNLAAAGRPPTATPAPTPTLSGPACTSTADCLAKMTLDEKIGQMTQASKNALTTPSDITTYSLGSLLSGGGEGPNG